MVADRLDGEGGRDEDPEDAEDATRAREDGDEGAGGRDDDLEVDANRDLEVHDLEKSVLLCEVVEAD